MPQFKSTNRQLYEFNAQQEQLQNTLVGKILNGRLKDFKVKHFSLSETLTKRLAFLNRSYFVFLGSKMQMRAIFENKPKKLFGIKIGTKQVPTGNEEPVMMPDKTMANYEMEFNKIMDEEIILEF